MKKMTMTVLCALAAAAFSLGAAAQEVSMEADIEIMDAYEDTTDLADKIDFNEAVEYAEVIDDFEDDFGDKWEVYYDDFQSFMWEQRIGMSDAEVVKSLEGNDLDTVTLMSPDYVVIYTHVYNYGCTSTSNPGYMYTSFWADGSCGRSCYRWSFWGAPYHCVRGLSARANTGSSNLCDFQWSDLECWHWEATGMETSDNCSCSQSASDYKYYNSDFGIDDDYLDDWADVIKYKYWIDSSNSRYMTIYNKWIE